MRRQPCTGRPVSHAHCAPGARPWRGPGHVQSGPALSLSLCAAGGSHSLGGWIGRAGHGSGGRNRTSVRVDRSTQGDYVRGCVNDVQRVAGCLLNFLDVELLRADRRARMQWLVPARPVAGRPQQRAPLGARLPDPQAIHALGIGNYCMQLVNDGHVVQEYACSKFIETRDPPQPSLTTAFWQYNFHGYCDNVIMHSFSWSWPMDTMLGVILQLKQPVYMLGDEHPSSISTRGHPNSTCAASRAATPSASKVNKVSFPH